MFKKESHIEYNWAWPWQMVRIRDWFYMANWGATPEWESCEDQNAFTIHTHVRVLGLAVTFRIYAGEAWLVAQGEDLDDFYESMEESFQKLNAQLKTNKN